MEEEAPHQAHGDDGHDVGQEHAGKAEAAGRGRRLLMARVSPSPTAVMNTVEPAM